MSVSKMETGYTIRDVMSKNVLTIEPEANIVVAAKLMAERQLGSIVVCRKSQVVGILTEQDMSRKVLARCIDPKKTCVSDIMTKKVHTVRPEKDLYEAMVQMGREKIKHLPVVTGRKLVGIISFKDIIRIEPDLIDMVSFKSSLTEKENSAIFAKA
jgi:signal-transduction protein with cAMP-binding, CBS, and nucleotidyltransferase domain